MSEIFNMAGDGTLIVNFLLLSAILEFGGLGRDEHFGISEGKGGGVKMLMPPVVGYGYNFWNHPFNILLYCLS